MFYHWIQKLAVPSDGTSSSKRMRFSKVATFWAFKYILTSCITTSHFNLVWKDFEEFYNMIKSTSLLESHFVLSYLNVMYFFAILVWSHKVQSCTPCKLKKHTSYLLNIWIMREGTTMIWNMPCKQKSGALEQPIANKENV